MSLDLTLLPFDGDQKDLSFSHTVLSCVSNCRDLYEEMNKFQEAIGTPNSLKIMGVKYNPNKDERMVPKDFTSFISRDEKYEEPHYGKTITDPQGTPLRWLYIKELLQWKNHAGVLRNQKHKAIWAYLELLDPESKVALYWH